VDEVAAMSRKVAGLVCLAVVVLVLVVAAGSWLLNLIAELAPH
jgi:hypothetical protein